MKSQNCNIQYKQFVSHNYNFFSQNWKFISCNCNLTSNNCNFMSQFSLLSCEIKKLQLLFLLVYSVVRTDFHEILLQNHLNALEVNQKERSSLSQVVRKRYWGIQVAQNAGLPKWALSQTPTSLICHAILPLHTNLHGPTPTASQVLRGLGWQTDLACPLTVTLMHWGQGIRPGGLTSLTPHW